tara:strand:- start:32 stop:529 length:498 start_codon:yes stop_codon:yes gene_type:complete
MIRFKSYIEEEIKYRDSKPDAEHNEVHTQLDAHKVIEKEEPKHKWPDHVVKQLKHLSNKKNFVSAMKKSKTTYVHHTDKDLDKINNSDVWDKKGIKGSEYIDKAKKDRVSKQFEKAKKDKNFSIEKPIILHHKETGFKHLLAGNTRLTAGVHDHKDKVPVHTIEY